MLKRFATVALVAFLPLVGACDSRASAPGQAPAAPPNDRPAAAEGQPADQSKGEPAAPAPETPAAKGESRNPIAKMLSKEPDFREVTVPAGTLLPVDLETAVSSVSSNVEDPVRGTLRRAVLVDGYEALPAGSTLSGVVTSAQRSGRVKGRAHVAFRFNTLRARDERIDVRTGVIGRAAPGTKKEDVAKIGIGAGAGAVIGGVIGGGSGAAKGAAIGGAGGTGVVLATRGKEVSLPSGADLSVKLLEPITVRVPLKRQ
jgi:hypothetical protein